MKIAVINFSGNVGKTTVARHLLAPRIPGAQVIAIESINAVDRTQTMLRGDQFTELQAYLQGADSAVVDVGASNVEELLSVMQRYSGSHEDFDYYVVPTVPEVKQQHDTIATLVELLNIGIAHERIRLVFNHAGRGKTVEDEYAWVLKYLAADERWRVSYDCRIAFNELYGRIRGAECSVAELAADPTDYKSLIITTPAMAAKMELTQQLANQRLARGVLPALDACFSALNLVPVPADFHFVQS